MPIAELIDVLLVVLETMGPPWRRFTGVRCHCVNANAALNFRTKTAFQLDGSVRDEEFHFWSSGADELPEATSPFRKLLPQHKQIELLQVAPDMERSISGLGS